MQRSGELEDRLRSSLKQTVPERGQPEQPFYEVVRSPGQVLVVERNKAGEAEIEFTVPAGCTCILWRLPTGLFEFLREDKNADGPFLVQRSDGQFEAHIVECKKTVDQKKWSDITEQMRWTLCKLMALAGALGVQVEEAVLYTAYRFDKLSEHESPNPAAAKRLIGDPDAQSPEEVEYTERGGSNSPGSATRSLCVASWQPSAITRSGWMRRRAGPRRRSSSPFRSS